MTQKTIDAAHGGEDLASIAAKVNANFNDIYSGRMYGTGTVASLPPAANAGSGARSFVTDSTVAGSGNFGAIVAGGSSNKAPVYSDGANWLIG